MQNIINNIFSVSDSSFFSVATQIAHYQQQYNKVYQQWHTYIRKDNRYSSLEEMPFLPIRFFKQFTVSAASPPIDIIFESSGTTQSINSKHFVKDVSIYQQSYNTTFSQFYGNIQQYCVLGLLPAYLERKGSSLVYMVNHFIEQSKHPKSGFYLHNTAALYETLVELEKAQQPTLLFGVTFALLDFAQQYKLPLQHTTIIETGGMKGRKKEITKQEVHALLQNSFGKKHIHAEYGMTELLSQAYSTGNGVYKCPPYLKVLVRSEDDPLDIKIQGKGILNIIDLANVYSCSFIATDDVGIVYEDGSFEVLGRLDNTDIRGCSLLTA